MPSGLKSLVVLMMEEEQPEGLSARKLVVETAKHNVLTAYTWKMVSTCCIGSQKST